MQNSQYFLNDAAAPAFATAAPVAPAFATDVVADAITGTDGTLKNVEDAIDKLQSFTSGGTKVQLILELMRKLKTMLDFSSQFNEYGHFVKNSRKLSYEEIFGEEIPKNEGMFNPPVVYNGCQITFLKKHRGLLLPDPIKLKKVKFGFLVSELTDSNLLLLKDELKQLNVEIHPKMQTDRSFYIRGIDGNPCVPNFDGPVKVKISIQGFKIRDGNRNPVWKLLDVFNC